MVQGPQRSLLLSQGALPRPQLPCDRRSCPLATSQATTWTVNKQQQLEATPPGSPPLRRWNVSLHSSRVGGRRASVGSADPPPL